MEYLFVIYIGLIIAALILALIFRKDYSSYAWSMIGLLVLTLVIELLKYIDHNKRDLLMAIYYIGELIFLGYAYYIVTKNKKIKRIIKLSVIALTVVHISISFFGHTQLSNLVQLIINHTFFIIVGIIYVFETYVPPFKEGKLIQNPFFWINTANLFFFSGLFLQLGFDSYVKSLSKELSGQLHTINVAINYLYYLLFSIGFVCKRVFK